MTRLVIKHKIVVKKDYSWSIFAFLMASVFALSLSAIVFYVFSLVFIPEFCWVMAVTNFWAIHAYVWYKKTYAPIESEIVEHEIKRGA